jgi:putative Mn2+ efflux pump MntP
MVLCYNLTMFALRGLILVSLSLGLSNFAAAIGIGLSGTDSKTRIKTGVAFGLFEAAMPLFGLLIGKQLAGSIGNTGKYIGGGLLIAMGAYNFWQSQKKKETQGKRQDFRRLLVTGFALSVDNLVVGFALSLYRTPIFLAAAIIGTVSVAMSLVGLELGDRLGERLEKWSEEAGAAVLSFVGIALLLGWL